MKLVNTAVIFFLFVCAVSAQVAKTSAPTFDNKDFSRKFEVVEWLVEYDNVAWKTTDVLIAESKDEMNRLGQEWFCFKDKNKVWHAVYGKLDGDKYDAIFHFEMDAAQKIKRSTEKIDQEFLNGHARALKTGRDKLTATVPPGAPRFNQFIRQNPDKTFSVWLLPAFQPNRMAVYGGEAIYMIDAAGTKILKDESYFQIGFRGLMSEPPREIWLDYSEMEKPSLGAIFFVWYYKSYFTSIMLSNEKSTSTVVKTPAGYIWVHVEKDESKDPK